MKAKKLEEIKQDVISLGFTIVDEDLDKPWGAYLVIDEKQSHKFVDTYFKEYKTQLPKDAVISPKYLILEPGHRFSWQVHERRGEVWKIVKGPLGVFTAEVDELPPEYEILQEGDAIYMEKGVRHRLVGLDNWGIAAEIWVHTDPNNLSDESDIRRIADDYNR